MKKLIPFWDFWIGFIKKNSTNEDYVEILLNIVWKETYENYTLETTIVCSLSNFDDCQNPLK